MRLAAGVLLVVGMLQMAGEALRLPAVKALGAAITASPAPKVFSAVRGLETYSTQFFIELTDPAGAIHSYKLTSEKYARLHGPYNRRNVYGAALAYGPVLVSDPNARPMFEAVARYGMCGRAPLLAELGIAPHGSTGTIRLRYEPIAGSDLGDLPRVIELSCK